MPERILVPLDGSSDAEIVLPYAEEIAAKLGTEIILVSVSESKTADIKHLYHAYLEQVTQEVQSQLQDYGAKEVSRVSNDVLLGNPADEILHYADEHDVSLIVMASRGSSARGPWLLGDISAKVLRATSRPVLLVRAPAKDVALQQKKLVKRILVPLDGSETGEAAIPYTEALTSALGAELVLLQVVEPPVITASLPEVGAPYPVPVDDERRKTSAITYLDGIGKPLQEKGLKISSAIDTGSAADQIIDYAQANAIDLIAMSTHGRSGIGRWVFGSVTDKVLHAGDTAVLVIRAAKI